MSSLRVVVCISDGENVYAAQVENVISRVAGGAEVGVIGVPDEGWVELERAIAVRKPGSSVGAADVIEHCSTRLAKYKVTKSALFVDEIPDNATGEVLRRELRMALGQP